MTFAAVENAISNLANNMRIYTEANLRFPSLFDVDREEAIHNIERAFEAKLEAFHTLYDVSRKHFPYFDHGDTSALIALRNALHHRDHPLFQGLLSEFWLQKSPDRWSGATFLLARHQMLSEGSLRMHAFFKLEDFRLRLDPTADSPYREKKIKPEKAVQRFRLIRSELGFDTILQAAEAERYPASQVYIDMMPVFVSAIVRVFRALRKIGVNFKGHDAAVYQIPFTAELEVDLGAISYSRLQFDGLPEAMATKANSEETMH